MNATTLSVYKVRGRLWPALQQLSGYAVQEGLSGSQCDDDGGGFFLSYKDLGGRFNDSLHACAFFFFLKWIAHAHQFHSLGQDQSTVAQWEVGIIHVQSEFVKL